MWVGFLDTLVSRRNGIGVIDVYRKSTHTDQYLEFSSHHETKHKNQYCLDPSVLGIQLPWQLSRENTCKQRGLGRVKS